MHRVATGQNGPFFGTDRGVARVGRERFRGRRLHGGTRLSRTLLAAMVMLLASCCLVSTAAAQALPTDPALVTGQLENGLQYVIRQHALPPGRATVWLHLDTGSLNETDQQRGLAHYLEHMAFNGSENFPPGAVVPFFQSLGMTFGRDQNAFTSFNQTTYQLSLPDVQEETITKGMTFFADILYRLALPPKEIENERQIIQEERRRSLSGQQRTMYYVLEHLAPGSLLGQRIPIGTKETINRVQRSDFEDYYNKWYVASNATLLVVADTDPQKVITLIKKSFGDAPKKPRPTPQDAGVKAYDKSFAIVASDPEVKSEQLTITRLEPIRPPTTTVPQLRDDLVVLLGTMAFNRRMADKVSAGGTDYLSGSASAGNQVGTIYTAEVGGRAKPGQWKPALQELSLELQRARKFGFAEQELADASKKIVAAAHRSVQREPTSEASTLLSRMNQAVEAREPMMSAQQRLELIEQLVPTITAAEVSQRFAKEFDPTVFSVTAILPASADVPSKAELLEIARKALAVEPKEEAVAEHATKLMETLPKPGDIVELAEHTSTGVWSGWLSNNARVHYRFMDTHKNQVTISISLMGGELLETAENRGITQAATIAWMQPATQRLTSADVRALMAGKNVNVGSAAGRGRGGGSDNTDSIVLTVSGSPDDLEAGMQLAHLLLTEPKVEPVALGRLTTMLRVVLEQIQTNPMMTGMQMAQGIVFPPQVARTQPLTIPQLDRLGSVPAAQAWLDKLIAKSPIEISVVGDLPKDRALELVTRYLGSIPKRPRVSKSLYRELRKIERPEGPRCEEKSIKTETPQAFVFSGFYGADESNVADMRALTVGAMILSTRMNKEIRENQQLVYSIRAGSRPGTTYPGFGVVSAAAPTDPAKTDRLVKIIAVMYAKMAKDGVTDEELDVAKKQVAVTLEQQMRDPNYWLSRLSEMTFYDKKLDDVVEAAASYQAITAKRVHETFARYYSPEKSIVVVVKPEE